MNSFYFIKTKDGKSHSALPVSKGVYKCLITDELITLQDGDSVTKVKVGTEVLIIKPDNPIIGWHGEGMMDKYHNTRQVITHIEERFGRVRFSVGLDNTCGMEWVFSLDCIADVQTNKTKLMTDELEDGYVLDYKGFAILEEDALLIECGNYKDEYVSPEDAVDTLDGVCTCDDEYITTLCGSRILYRNTSDHDFYYVSSGYNRNEWVYVDDLVYCDQDGEYYHTDSIGEYIYYNNNTGEYQLEEPGSSRCHGYHSQSRGFRNSDARTAEFKIGFEVEKEDEHVLDTYDLSDADATLWCREEDGSLDDESGFELVSPVYNLNDDTLDSDIHIKSVLRDHINADFSTNCGGHINLSREGYSGKEFYDQIVGFVPLLFGMYRGRLGGSWSYFRTATGYRESDSKYNAVRVDSNKIEFRIFSAVRNVTNLLWRRDLLRIVTAEADNGRDFMWWLQQAITDGSPVRTHLLKVYSPENLNKRIMWACGYADKFYETNAYLDLEFVPGEQHEKQQVRASLY